MNLPLMKEGTLQSAATATGNGVAMEIAGFRSIAVIISGTFVGTVTFEVSHDGSTYEEIVMRKLDATSETYAFAPTAPAAFAIDLAGGFRYFRARVSAYTSGSITVTAGAC